MTKTTLAAPVRTGVWPLPPTLRETETNYRFEVCENTCEARLRIYKGSVKTSAYILIPQGQHRPDHVRVEDWIKAQAFYQREDKKLF